MTGPELFFSGRASTTWLAACLYGVLSVAVAYLLVPDLLRPYPRFAEDSHMRLSFNHAVSAAYCGTLNVSDVIDLPTELTVEPDRLFEPIRDLIAHRYGSMDAYCGKMVVPRINNEPSLMWLMRAILFVRPGISTAGIGGALAAIRLATVLLLCIALYRAGASVFLASAAALATCSILWALAPYQYNNDPFFLTLPALVVGLYVLLMTDQPRTPAVTAAAFAAIGAMSAFGANMRTSHTPIYIAMFVAVAAAWSFGSRHTPAATVRGAIVVVTAFALAYVAAHMVLVKPIRELPGEGTPHHLIAHPLVLGLANPENELSLREGLRWNDGVGLTIARRVDPNVTYLGPGYEKALFRYYTDLWRTHPLEMLHVYWLKFHVAGGDMLQDPMRLLETRGVTPAIARRIGAVQISGILLGVAQLGTAVLGWRLFRRTGSALGIAWLLVSIAAAGVLTEAALIIPFQIFYSSFLLLYVLVTPAAIAQLAADAYRSRAAAPGRS